MSTLDTGVEVQFHARNERMQNEKERRFRLRHQDREYVRTRYSEKRHNTGQIKRTIATNVLEILTNTLRHVKIMHTENQYLPGAVAKW